MQKCDTERPTDTSKVFLTMTRGPHDTHSALGNPASLGLSSLPAPRRARLLSKLVIVGGLGLFGAAAAIGMVRQPDHMPLPPTSQVKDVLPLSESHYEVSETPAPTYITETRIQRGDTLAAVLQRLDIDAPGLQSFLTHDSTARSIYKLYPGRAVQAAMDESGKLSWLRYVHTPGNETEGKVVTKLLEVRPVEGGFQAEERVEGTDREVRVAVGTIQSSLFGATDTAGIPDGVTTQMADVLGAKIDFLRDIRQGDQFRVVYETHSYQGRYAGAGRLLAVEFTNRGKVHNAVWFNDGERGAYYDFEGTNLRGTFLRNALKFSRISSTFGMRQHPIHGRWMGHKGVDYAAPTGTPIHSTADGVVDFAGTQSGYGNVVIVRHSDKYTTLYAHQSRIAEGVRKGTRVSQGQLIGYVGQTGWATGPHLHYEFRIAGQPVDPLSVDLPVAHTMEASAARKFETAVTPIKEQIAMLAQFQTSLSDELTNVAAR